MRVFFQTFPLALISIISVKGFPPLAPQPSTLRSCEQKSEWRTRNDEERGNVCDQSGREWCEEDLGICLSVCLVMNVEIFDE